MSSLHDVEEVIHTAFRPASELCDEERRLLYLADAVGAVGEAGHLCLASSEHVATSANPDTPLQSLHELQDAMATASTHQRLSDEEQDSGHMGNSVGVKTRSSCIHTPQHSSSGGSG